LWSVCDVTIIAQTAPYHCTVVRKGLRQNISLAYHFHSCYSQWRRSWSRPTGSAAYAGGCTWIQCYIYKRECGPMPNVSSVIPFLVPRCKVWLTPTGRVPRSNAANISLRECKTWTQSEVCTWQNSVRGQKPRKCIDSVPAQETAKHRAKFGWPPVNDVAAVTKPRRETR